MWTILSIILLYKINGQDYFTCHSSNEWEPSRLPLQLCTQHYPISILFFLNDTLFLYFTTLIITICIRRLFLYGSPRLWKDTHSSIFEILITPLLLIGIKIIQENRWFNLIGMYTWRNQQRSMSRNFFSWLHHWVPISLSVW